MTRRVWRTVYKGDPMGEFALDGSSCLSGLTLEDDDNVLVADTCQGFGVAAQAQRAGGAAKVTWM